MQILHPTAIVIEPDLVVADILFDALTSWGFTVGLFSSHADAADAATATRRIDLLLAGVASSGSDRLGGYLMVARIRQRNQLPTVLIVPTPDVFWPDTPYGAVRLPRPFTQDELLDSVLISLATSHGGTELQ